MKTPGFRGWLMRAVMVGYMDRLTVGDWRIIARRSIAEYWHARQFNLLIVLLQVYLIHNSYTSFGIYFSLFGLCIALWGYLSWVWKMPKTKSARLALQCASQLQKLNTLKQALAEYRALTTK